MNLPFSSHAGYQKKQRSELLIDRRSSITVLVLTTFVVFLVLDNFLCYQNSRRIDIYIYNFSNLSIVPSLCSFYVLYIFLRFSHKLC